MAFAGQRVAFAGQRVAFAGQRVVFAGQRVAFAGQRCHHHPGTEQEVTLLTVTSKMHS